jgi:hypothetical protein
MVRGGDTAKRLISSPNCRSVKVINNPARPGLNHMKVNYINNNNNNNNNNKNNNNNHNNNNNNNKNNNNNNNNNKLKRTLRCKINVRIKQ